MSRKLDPGKEAMKETHDGVADYLSKKLKKNPIYF